jgi:hypothetical protein
VSAYTLTQPELYYSLPAAVTKAPNSTSQVVISAAGSTSVPRCVVPAEYFSVTGKSFHFEANGTVSTAATADTLTFAAGLDAAAGTIGGTGGATLFTAGALTLAAASTTYPWTMEFDGVCQAAGNLGTTIQLNGEINVHNQVSGAWSSQTSTRLTAMVAATLTGLNNEVALWLELFGTWSAANAANTTTVQQFKVYLEN